MKESLRTGISFGLTSAIITTLGLMVGLHSGSGSKIVVLAGILTIAIADAFSDALGIHVSEESENTHTVKQNLGRHRCYVHVKVNLRLDIRSTSSSPASFHGHLC